MLCYFSECSEWWPEIPVSGDIARAGSRDMRLTEQRRQQFLFKLYLVFDDSSEPVPPKVRVAGVAQESLFMLVQDLTGGDRC
jgi:hypothetical protein